MYLNQIAWIAWPIWMPLVGIFWAKMWRRSGLVTTGELIELRYSGRGAAAFRGFYGVYACLGWATVFLGYGTAMLAQILGADDRMVSLGGGPRLRCGDLGLYPDGGLLGAAYIDLPQFAIFFLAAVVVWYFGVQEFGSYAAMLEKAMVQRDLSFWQIFSALLGDEYVCRSGDLGGLDPDRVLSRRQPVRG